MLDKRHQFYISYIKERTLCVGKNVEIRYNVTHYILLGADAMLYKSSPHPKS